MKFFKYIVSPSEDVRFSNVRGLYLRKYGICFTHKYPILSSFLLFLDWRNDQSRNIIEKWQLKSSPLNSISKMNHFFQGSLKNSRTVTLVWMNHISFVKNANQNVNVDQSLKNVQILPPRNFWKVCPYIVHITRINVGKYFCKLKA